MGFGTGVDYRQSLWLPVSFCPKILKSNAFRHTISEVLNLLEGSDAIYGVIVTRHAADRMLERGGLNRKSIQRIANQVYSNGYPIERTKGRLRKWMYKISKSNPSAQNLRIYGDKLYIFSNDVLITVFNIPNNLKMILSVIMVYMRLSDTVNIRVVLIARRLHISDFL